MNLNQWAKPSLLTLAIGLFSGASSGCSSLKPGNDVYQSALSEQWSCITQGTAPTPPMPNLAMIHYIVAIVDFDNTPSVLDPTKVTPMAFIPDLDIKVCPAGDPNCTAPITATVSNPKAIAGYTYVYQIDIPGALDPLYLRITQQPKTPLANQGLLHLPTDYFFAGPLVGAQDGTSVINGEAIPIPTLANASNLIADLGVQADLTRGIVAIRTIDCQGHRASGVRLQLSPSSATAGSIGYLLTAGGVGRKIDLGSTDPADATDLRGVAGFANLSRGTVTFSGALLDGTTYGSSNVRISPGVFTVSEIRPITLFAK